MEIEEINKLYNMVTSEDKEMSSLGITLSIERLRNNPFSSYKNIIQQNTTSRAFRSYIVSALATLAYREGIKYGELWKPELEK